MLTRQKIGNREKRRPTSEEDAGQTNGGLGWLLLFLDRISAVYSCSAMCVPVEIDESAPKNFACMGSVE